MSYNNLIDILISKAGTGKIIYREDLIDLTMNDLALYREIEQALLDRNINIRLSDYELLDTIITNTDEQSSSELEEKEHEEAYKHFISSNEKARINNYEAIVYDKKRLLTKKEVKTYCIKMEAGKKASEKLKEFEFGTIVLNDIARQLLETQVKEADSALNIIFDSNVGLAYYFARLYLNKTNLTHEDLCQEALMGLFTGIKRFDYRKDVELSTYVHWYIKKAIRDAIIKTSRHIFIPHAKYADINKMNFKERELTQKLDRIPTIEEMAKAMDMSVEGINTLKSIKADVVFLDNPIGDKDDNTHLDLYKDMSIDPHQQMIKELDKDITESLLSKLSEREERVIRLRFGFYDGKRHQQNEIAELLKVSKPRIHQIEKQAIKNLRAFYAEKGYELRQKL